MSSPLESLSGNCTVRLFSNLNGFPVATIVELESRRLNCPNIPNIPKSVVVMPLGGVRVPPLVLSMNEDYGGRCSVLLHPDLDRGAVYWVEPKDPTDDCDQDAESMYAAIVEDHNGQTEFLLTCEVHEVINNDQSALRYRIPGPMSSTIRPVGSDQKDLEQLLSQKQGFVEGSSFVARVIEIGRMMSAEPVNSQHVKFSFLNTDEKLPHTELQLNSCTFNALQMAKHTEWLSVCVGFYRPQGQIGGWLEHCWNIDPEGRVVDASLPNGGATYFGVKVPLDVLSEMKDYGVQLAPPGSLFGHVLTWVHEVNLRDPERFQVWMDSISQPPAYRSPREEITVITEIKE